MEQEKRTEQPCPICGKAEYAWGRLEGQLAHVPDDSGVMAKIFPWPQSVQTRICAGCGNLQLFGEQR